MAKNGRPRARRPRASPLRDWVSSRDVGERPTADELARSLKVSRTHVYGLLDGSRQPSLSLAKRIRTFTGGAVTWGV